MVGSFILFFVALMLMLAAVLSMLRARRLEQVGKVNQRLKAVDFLAVNDSPLGQRDNELVEVFSRWLRRVGIQVEPGVALIILMLAIGSGIGILKIWGLLAAVLWWVVLSVVSVLIPQVMYQQKISKMVGQVPLFIDQIIRGLATGRNVEGAIKLAAEDLQEPLRNIIMRAQKNVELGDDLGDALRDAANFHDIKELHMLALAIHTSRVYGGSPREMLESIVNLIRQREQMQRELRAMTGETRMSAWVLGAIPSSIVVYIMAVNPKYMLDMWHDETGHNILLGALGLQIFGALLLWRMVTSI